MKSQPIRLGELFYVLESNDSSLVERCARLFKHAATTAVVDPAKQVVVDLDKLWAEMGSIEAMIHPIVARAAAEQARSIWLDAAVLRSWNAKTVLLMGSSYSGKSTLAFACWAYLSCRIVCEDVTLIDVVRNCLIPFCRPLSLRPNSWDLLQVESTELAIEGEWVSAPTMFSNLSCAANFDLAVFLDGTPHGQPIVAEQLEPNSFCRAALRFSNLTRVPEMIDKFVATLPPSGCYRISEGAISERVDFVRQAIS